MLAFPILGGVFFFGFCMTVLCTILVFQYFVLHFFHRHHYHLFSFCIYHFNILISILLRILFFAVCGFVLERGPSISRLEEQGRQEVARDLPPLRLPFYEDSLSEINWRLPLVWRPGHDL